MDKNIYKIAIAAFLHDIGKFAERANMQVGVEFLNNNADLYQPHYNNRYTHKHALYTAAFIDHIEKFLPREFNRGDWGIGDSFINLASGHHKPETPLQWIIAIADRVSSGFDREEFEDYNKGVGVRDYKRTRLLTIFEGINPDGAWKNDNLESYNYRYPLQELSPDNIFPIDSAEFRAIDNDEAANEYKDLFFNFVDSLERLRHKRNIPLWFEHFDSLFMIYGSHIPAATVGKVVPDVSLYDHCKITAALASALYLYHLQQQSLEIEKIRNYDENKFLIVTGDFYGIQNFIFAEGGSTSNASAKLLRGRSFAVSLITELAADLLCRETGLTNSSIILNAAGKFTLVAPNTDMTISKIKEVEERINDWLIKKFYGESTLGISSVEASCNDFTSGKFPDLWEMLGKEAEKKKYHKINLDKNGGAVSGYLGLFNNDLGKKLCPFCGKRPSSAKVEKDSLLGDEESACTICRDHIYFGTNLVKSQRIAITTVDADIEGDKLSEPIFDFYQVSLNVTGRLGDLSEKGSLLKYWDISLSEDKEIAKDITAKFINGYVPVYSTEDEAESTLNRLLHGHKSEKSQNELFDLINKGHPKNFHHLAKMALNQENNGEGKFCGLEALGILKADVDNLGLIFACGLKRNSLSRLATLSRQMNHYFSIYLPLCLKTKEEFKDIYTVFAGGDDLFLIGPWNRIIDFALFLNGSFKKYVCENEAISISAGLSVHKPGEPVPYIGEMSEEALKKSKGNGRNSVTIFDESVKWEIFLDLNEIKKTMEAWMHGKVINNAMLFRLNTFAYLAKQKQELLTPHKGIDMEEFECLIWESLFKYTLVRNIGKDLKGEEKNKAIEEVEKAADWLIRYGGAVKIPLWQVIYNRR